MNGPADRPPVAGKGAPLKTVRRGFLLLCAGLGWVPALPLGLALRWASAAAYLLTFILVAADFLWVSWSFAALFQPGSPTRGAMTRGVTAIGLRMVLLLLGLYGILRIFPRELLGVCLGIGTPLVIVAIAGAVPVRGAK